MLILYHQLRALAKGERFIPPVCGQNIDQLTSGHQL